MSRPLSYLLTALAGVVIGALLLSYGCTEDTGDIAREKARADSLQASAQDWQAKAQRETEAADRSQAEADAKDIIIAALMSAQEIEREATARAFSQYIDAAKQAETDKDAAEQAPDSLPLAQQALRSCTTARSWCEATVDAQRVQIATADSLIETQAAQIVQLDTTTVRLRRANSYLSLTTADLTLALDSQREVSDLLTTEVRRQKRRVLLWQGITGAVTVAAAYLAAQ